MAVNYCMPLDIHEKGLIFAPKRKNIDLDISVPKAVYHNTNRTYNVNLVHWSNYRTKLSLYKFEVEKLKTKKQSGVIYKLLFKYRDSCNRKY